MEWRYTEPNARTATSKLAYGTFAGIPAILSDNAVSSGLIFVYKRPPVIYLRQHDYSEQ